MTLEDKLFEDIRAGRQVDIERALLIVSGCGTEERISEYKAKLDKLDRKFKAFLSGYENAMQTANVLPSFLWSGRPNRYNGNFFLTKVIDAQLSEDKSKGVGNCVGLTSLYTCLGVRNNLEMRALVMPIHVASRVIIGKEKVDVENCYKDGFGWDFSSKHVQDAELLALVASVINSRGSVFYRRGELKKALHDFNGAIEINPQYAGGFNNRGNVFDDRGESEKALHDYDKAIQINPQYATAFYNRGLAREKLGDLKEAEEDFEMYKKLKGESR